MTLENAIELIKQEYEKANDNHYVINPLAYALYQVWKKADAIKAWNRRADNVQEEKV